MTPRTGPPVGGTRVKVTGSNLAGATEVRFGDAAGLELSATGNRIFVDTPAGPPATKVTVTVMTPEGNVAAGDFTYTAVVPGGTIIPPPLAPGAGAAGVALGGALGATIFGAGNGGTAALGLAVAAAAPKPAIEKAVAATTATLRRIAALRIAREREALARAGYSADEITKAVTEEIRLEAIYQRRAAERMRKALTLASRATDPSARQSAVESAARREQNYARQRAIASGARVFASVERTALEEQSPQGAYWKLGVAVEHTPDCLAMAGKLWPWSVLRKIHPLLHVGCKCTLLSYGEALALGLLGPGTILSPAEAERLAAPVIEYVRRHHGEGLGEEALAELVIRNAWSELCEGDPNLLAAAPLLCESEPEEEVAA
jgi:hypothetical protein